MKNNFLTKSNALNILLFLCYVWFILQILYEANEFEESSRNTEEIFNEAMAIYQLAYGHAMSDRGKVGNCGFAWKVAGSALLKLHTMKQSEKAFVCLPSVLRELF